MEERRQTWLKNLESRGGGKRKRRWSAMTKLQSSFLKSTSRARFRNSLDLPTLVL